MPKIIENIRETLLEKGKEMLLTGSFAEFNMRSLARNCNFGLGTVYNYFTSKEELAYHIFKQDWEQTLALVDTMKESGLPLREKLRQVYTSLEIFIGQYMEIFREMAGHTAKGCPNDNYREIFGKMKELLEQEQQAGRIDANIGAEKLAYFIMTNLFYNAKNKALTFDELYECFRL